jgi:hypothetical protein
MTLKEVYAKYKKYVVAAGISLAIVLSMSWVFKACDLKDGYSVKAGEYKAQLARKKADEARVKRENAALYQDIVAQDAKIGKLEADIKAKTQNITHLTNAISGLNTDLAAARTDAERVVILTTLVENYKEKCGVYEAIIVDKDKEIAAWGVKFVDMEKVASNYKGLWEEALIRESALNSMNTKLSNQLKVARFGGKLKTGLVLTALAVVAYGELTK